MIKRRPLNPPQHIYPLDPWRIIEQEFCPRFLAQAETIFSLGNGYLGMRGSFEEGTPVFENGSFINAFYEVWPICYGEEAHGTRDELHHFRVEVIFGGVDPQAVQVELFAPDPENHVWRQPMARGDKLPDREGGYLFTSQVPATRPAGDFTPRLIPAFSGVAVPLEIPLILWHH